MLCSNLHIHVVWMAWSLLYIFSSELFVTEDSDDDESDEGSFFSYLLAFSQLVVLNFFNYLT